MRLLILSDLHREIWRERAPRIDVGASRPDVVLLAGDISTGVGGVVWAAEAFNTLPVLYVSGNHEFYGRNMEPTYRELAAASAETPNVKFLQTDEWIFAGVRFLGATLWTDFSVFGEPLRQGALRQAGASMNDYKRIRLSAKGYRTLRPTDTAYFHAQQRAWLREKLTQKFDGKTVVVTHMAPSMRSISDRYSNDLISAAYASNMDELVVYADLWVHGHTHESADYCIGDCRVVANPCGYMTRGGEQENGNFDPCFIVEI